MKDIQAFPRPRGTSRDRNNCDAHNNSQNGMTLRDYFAGQALIGVIINSATVTVHTPLTMRAYEIADAMLERREE